jgi:hypothetical protein
MNFIATPSRATLVESLVALLETQATTLVDSLVEASRVLVVVALV